MKSPSWILLTTLAMTQGFADPVASVDAYGYVAFNHIDSDRNGYVSRVEARSVTAVENAFDSVDANGDGLLDRDEYTSVRMAGGSH